MNETNKEINPVISNSVSEATQKVLLNAIESGYDIEELADESLPTIVGRRKISDEGIDEVVSLSSKGRAIPGQSLTRSKEQPYPWETPPTFSKPQEALDNILSSMIKPKAAKHIVNALAKGASVTDLSLSILYSKFVNGEINPDLMLLLSEPVAYTIMGLGEEANIKYNIDDNDIDELDPEEINEQKNKINNLFASVGKKTDNKETNISGVVPTSILAQIKEQGPKLRESLLSKGESKNV